MENQNVLKLFEEVASVKNSEGAEALTEERISELCKKYDISMTEFTDLVVEILSAGEIKSFSSNEEALENVAGGKMDFKKGTATLLAALNVAGPFASASAQQPETQNSHVNVAHSRKADKQTENNKTGMSTSGENSSAGFFSRNHEAAVKNVQNKLGVSSGMAKFLVGTAEVLALPIAAVTAWGIREGVNRLTSNESATSSDSMNRESATPSGALEVLEALKTTRHHVALPPECKTPAEALAHLKSQGEHPLANGIQTVIFMNPTYTSDDTDPEADPIPPVATLTFGAHDPINCALTALELPKLDPRNPYVGFKYDCALKFINTLKDSDTVLFVSTSDSALMDTLLDSNRKFRQELRDAIKPAASKKEETEGIDEDADTSTAAKEIKEETDDDPPAATPEQQKAEQDTMNKFNQGLKDVGIYTIDTGPEKDDFIANLIDTELLVTPAYQTETDVRTDMYILASDEARREEIATLIKEHSNIEGHSLRVDNLTNNGTTTYVLTSHTDCIADLKDGDRLLQAIGNLKNSVYIDTVDEPTRSYMEQFVTTSQNAYDALFNAVEKARADESDRQRQLEEKWAEEDAAMLNEFKMDEFMNSIDRSKGNIIDLSDVQNENDFIEKTNGGNVDILVGKPYVSVTKVWTSMRIMHSDKEFRSTLMNHIKANPLTDGSSLDTSNLVERGYDLYDVFKDHSRLPAAAQFVQAINALSSAGARIGIVPGGEAGGYIYEQTAYPENYERLVAKLDAMRASKINVPPAQPEADAPKSEHVEDAIKKTKNNQTGSTGDDKREGGRSTDNADGGDKADSKPDSNADKTETIRTKYTNELNKVAYSLDLTNCDTPDSLITAVENATEPLDKAIETLVVVYPKHALAKKNDSLAYAVVGRTDEINQILIDSDCKPLFTGPNETHNVAFYYVKNDTDLKKHIPELSALPNTLIVQSTNDSLIKALAKLCDSTDDNAQKTTQKILDAFNEHATKEAVEELKRKQEERKRQEEKVAARKKQVDKEIKRVAHNLGITPEELIAAVNKNNQKIKQAIETLVVINPEHTLYTKGDRLTYAVVGRTAGINQLLIKFGWKPLFTGPHRTRNAIFPYHPDLKKHITAISELPHTLIVQSTDASLIAALAKLCDSTDDTDQKTTQKILDAFNKHAPPEAVEELKRKQEERQEEEKKAEEKKAEERDKFMAGIDRSKGNIIDLSDVQNENDFIEKTNGGKVDIVVTKPYTKNDCQLWVSVSAMSSDPAVRQRVAHHISRTSTIKNEFVHARGIATNGISHYDLLDSINPPSNGAHLVQAINAFDGDVRVAIVDAHDRYIRELVDKSSGKYDNLVAKLEATRENDGSHIKVKRLNPLPDKISRDNLKNWLIEGGAVELDDDKYKTKKDLISIGLPACAKEHQIEDASTVLMLSLPEIPGECELRYALIGNETNVLKELFKYGGFTKIAGVYNYKYHETINWIDLTLSDLLADAKIPVIIVNDSALQEIISNSVGQLKIEGDEFGQFRDAPAVLAAFKKQDTTNP